jgi:hypothetical protein
MLSIYPDINNPNYNYSNNSVVYLSNFRENHFPVINEIFENNFHYSYKTSLKEFNKIGNFLNNSTFSKNSLNFFLSNKLSNNNNSFLLGLYIFLFFLENNFYYFLTNKHFFNVSKRNFAKFNFLFFSVLKNFKKKTLINTYNLNNVSD